MSCVVSDSREGHRLERLVAFGQPLGGRGGGLGRGVTAGGGWAGLGGGEGAVEVEEKKHFTLGLEVTLVDLDVVQGAWEVVDEERVGEGAAWEVCVGGWGGGG